MDTKQINNLINSIIGTEEFKKMQQDVAEKLFEKMENFPFESDDDVLLVSSRVRDYFELGMRFETTKKMTKLMGIDSKLQK